MSGKLFVKMNDGYLYCISNKSMPGILKIGMTGRTPDIRLKEANSSETWKPPTPYKIEFAKKVNNVKQKEITLHMLLTQYTERIHPKREFFRASLEEVKTFFNLMDGEVWIENISKEEEEDEEEDEDLKTNNVKKGCRDAHQCFTNGQRIRHTIGINKTWIGTYDSSKNGIIYGDKIFQGISPLNQFAKCHYEIEKKDRMLSGINAWRECECEVNGVWISTYNLNPLNSLSIIQSS